MKLQILTLLLTSAFVTHAEVVSQTPATPGATPAISRQRHWEARFKELDANGDGKLTLEEFLAGPMGKKSPEKARTFFQTIDQAHTGAITLDQWLAAHPEKAGGAEPAATTATPDATPAPRPVAAVTPTEPPAVPAKRIALKKTPPEVQKALIAAAGVSHLVGVEIFEEGGRTLYRGKFPGNQDMQEYTVDATGARARIRVYPYSLSKPVEKSINKHVGDGKIQIIEACFDSGKTYYRVKFTTKDGQESQFSVSERGVLQ